MRLNQKSMLGVMVFTLGLMSFTGCLKESEPEPTAIINQQKEDDRIEAWGTIDAAKNEEIHITFPATVTNVQVEEGDEVQKGDLLATIDYEEYKNGIKIKANEACLDESTLKTLIQQSQGQESEIAALNAQAENLKHNLEAQKDSEVLELKSQIKTVEDKLYEIKEDLKMQENLFEAGGVSQKSVNDLKNQMAQFERQKKDLSDKIEKRNESQRLQLKELKAQIEAKRTQLMANAKSNSANREMTDVKKNICALEVDNMKKKYEKSYINGDNVVLDIDKGIIDCINVEPGTVLGEQNSLVMRIIDCNSLFVNTSVPEEFIGEVKLGAKASIIPYADKSAKIKGKVVSIAKKATEENGETVIKVKVKPLEQNAYLNVGYNVDVEIEK